MRFWYCNYENYYFWWRDEEKKEGVDCVACVDYVASDQKLNDILCLLR